MSDFDRIAISGKMCSGKTTAANMLEREFDYKRMFFADELKILCRDISNYNKAVAAGLEPELRTPLLQVIWNDVQRITTTEQEYSAAMNQVLSIVEKFKEVTYYDPSSDKKTNIVRQMLQEVGTEYMRVNVCNNIWANALERNIQTSSAQRIVVDDLRYENEFETLRRNGFVMVRLNISKEVQQARLRKVYGIIDDSKLLHPSETALDHIMFDYVIDSDQPISAMLNDIRSMLGGN